MKKIITLVLLVLVVVSLTGCITNEEFGYYHDDYMNRSYNNSVYDNPDCHNQPSGRIYQGTR